MTAEIIAKKREKPILFNGDMVRAILDGRKTQTRRVMKVQPDPRTTDISICGDKWMGCGVSGTGIGTSQWDCWRSVPYQIGDQLWVRETFALSVIDPEGGLPEDDPENYDVIYREGNQPNGGWTDGNGNKISAPCWKPSIHMPRWASRIQLEITDIRIERIQEITEKDAKAEGCETVRVRSGFDGSMIDVPKGQSISPTCTAGWDDCREWFADLWESINGEGAWELNPWVWVITFKRVQP